MIEGPIVQDQVFKHIKSGEDYVVLNGNSDGDKDTQTFAKLGSDETDYGDKPGWQPAIVYYPEGEAGKTFVRDEATFRQKFERV